MKMKIDEANKLPIIFDFIQFKKINNKRKKNLYMNTCDKFQTDFMPLEKPEKKLVRFI